MIPKIFPRNLPARADLRVLGNPDISRLESGVGNCFPGLEFDHRNLDRRFFPGLVFEFASNDNDNGRRGARFLRIDLEDPDLESFPDLRKQLSGATGAQLQPESDWFLSRLTQGRKTIRMSRNGDNFDGLVVWRLVRCLETEPVTIELERRGADEGPRNITLRGVRRRFVDPAKGVFNSAYKPGELTQSLCSPWMHDFRDCACYYWASNHPDIVLGENSVGGNTLPSGAPEDPVLALTPIDWLRSDRSSHAPAMPTDGGNRPGQMDHYEINSRWQDLAIVLRGREVSNIFQPEDSEQANPFNDPDELADKLSELATLEHAVALEYLYARYSLLHPDDARDRALKDDLTFVRHEMLLVAVSEMRHLRWANQLLWSLEHDGMLSRDRGPSLGIAAKIPKAKQPSDGEQAPATRDFSLRALSPDVLNDFIAVEQPSGFLDGQYARVLSTLRQPKYRESLEQLAERIIAEGVEHFSRFREIQVVLKKYAQSLAYLRPDFREAGDTPVARAAVRLYDEIVDELRAAYQRGDMEDARHIARARMLMFELDARAEELARNNRGVPFGGIAAAAGGLG